MLGDFLVLVQSVLSLVLLWLVAGRTLRGLRVRERLAASPILRDRPGNRGDGPQLPTR